tara:strand:+ start:1101 stop:1607 length:507 start_codon:yes stop_codon:yes gene_type:complete
MICSRHKLTLEASGHILLDYGEEIERDVEIIPEGLSAAGNYAFAAEASLFGQGNLSFQISWNRVKQYASHVEADGWKLALLKTLPLYQEMTLLVEIEGGASFRFQEFVLQEPRFSNLVYDGFPLREEYSGLAAQMVIVDNAGLGGGTMSAITETHASITANHTNYVPL